MQLNFLTTVIISLLLVPGCCGCFSASGQNQPNKFVQVAAGYAGNNLKEKMVGAEYSMYCSRNKSMNINMRSFILSDDKRDDVNYNSFALQAGINYRNSFIRTKQHELLLSMGLFGRYNTVSKEILNAQKQGDIVSTTSDKDFAFGGLPQVQYNITCDKNFSLGVATGYQFDTKGKGVPQVALLAGRRF